MAEMGCARCGHRNPLGSNFCSSCGFALSNRLDDTTAVIAISVDPEAADAPAGPVAELPEEAATGALDTGTLEAGDLDADASGAGVLIVARGPNVGARIVLEGPSISMGRHPDSTIFLDDITVSRRHAEIVAAGDGYEIRDAGSLNGTYVNRERVDQARLQPGDEVQIGKFKLVYVARQGS